MYIHISISIYTHIYTYIYIVFVGRLGVSRDREEGDILQRENEENGPPASCYRYSGPARPSLNRARAGLRDSRLLSGSG